MEATVGGMRWPRISGRSLRVLRAPSGVPAATVVVVVVVDRPGRGGNTSPGGIEFESAHARNRQVSESAASGQAAARDIFAGRSCVQEHG